MKYVDLIGPTIVRDELRYPHENPVKTTNDEADRLHDDGVLAGEPRDEPARQADTQPVEPDKPA